LQIVIWVGKLSNVHDSETDGKSPQLQCPARVHYPASAYW